MGSLKERRLQGAYLGGGYHCARERKLAGPGTTGNMAVQCSRMNPSTTWAGTGDREKLALYLPWHLFSGSSLHSYVLPDNRQWASCTECTVPEGSEEVGGGWLVTAEGNE